MRMLQIADQFDAAVMSTAHAQSNGHFAILGRNRVNRQHLDSRGQNIFQVHHNRRPGEGFLGKNLIKKLRLVQYQSILRLPHICLKYLPLPLEGMNLGVHCIQACLGIGGLPLFRSQQQPQRHRRDRQ